jgi:hypothetical protein
VHSISEGFLLQYFTVVDFPNLSWAETLPLRVKAEEEEGTEVREFTFSRII